MTDCAVILQNKYSISPREFRRTLRYSMPKVSLLFYDYQVVYNPFLLYATLAYLSILKYSLFSTVLVCKMANLAIGWEMLIISKCSSMTEWHTVEMASIVHDNNISETKAQAYCEMTLTQVKNPCLISMDSMDYMRTL